MSISIASLIGEADFKSCGEYRPRPSLHSATEFIDRSIYGGSRLKRLAMS